MRNKRRKPIAVVLLALAALVVCVLVLPNREPAWQERTLSAWLGDFDADKPETRVSAAEAIRQIGTNALPIISYSLLNALREIDPEQAARFDPPQPAGTSASPLQESPGPE